MINNSHDHFGFVQLNRSFMHEEIFIKAIKTSVVKYLWLVMNAVDEATEVTVANKKVRILPGQFITSYGQLAKEWGGSAILDKRAVYRALDILSKKGLISVENHKIYTIITIVNWESWQGDSVDDLNQTPYEATI